MKTILAPVDFSNATANVVSEAAALARATLGRITLMHATAPDVILGEYVPRVESAYDLDEDQGRLNYWRDRLRGSGIETDTIMVRGEPAPAILEKAAAIHADYIVMGSHGHTALFELLVGGTARGVIKKASCPVVIVPSGQPEPLAETQVEAKL
jgi:nucleotide-binding universal stress UspA family protein